MDPHCRGRSDVDLHHLGSDLGNDGVGGRGYIFSFMWDRTNLPNDVRDCYPKALGLDGLDEFPFDEVPNL